MKQQKERSTRVVSIIALIGLAVAAIALIWRIRSHQNALLFACVGLFYGFLLYYGFKGYQKPHGNMIQILMLILADELESFLSNDICKSCEFSADMDRKSQRGDFCAVEILKIFNERAIGYITVVHVRYEEAAREIILLAEFPCLLCTDLNAVLAGDNDSVMNVVSAGNDIAMPSLYRPERRPCRR